MGPIDIWRAHIFGEPVQVPPDCNTCQWINITEEEQDQRIKAGVHRCTRYNYERLHHRAITMVHDSYIYPCASCEKDKYKAYISRQ